MSVEGQAILPSNEGKVMGLTIIKDIKIYKYGSDHVAIPNTLIF